MAAVIYESSRHALTRESNVLLGIVFFSLQIFLLILAPLLVLPVHASYGLLLLIPVLLTNSWWAYIHESIHGSLFAGRQANLFAGRINGILFGASFHLLRTGHMLHHALSRTPRERSEVYIAGKENRIAFTIAYYLRLAGGLYFYEILGGLLLLLPRSWVLRISSRIASENNVVEFLVERMLRDDVISAVRLDELLVLALYATAFVLYGEHSWMLVSVLLARGFLISVLDNAFHYGTPLVKPDPGRNLTLPKWAARMILNFNFHGNHHRHPSVPWHALPAVESRERGSAPAPLFPVMLSQFKGPIPVCTDRAGNQITEL